MPYIKQADRISSDIVVEEMHRQKIKPNGELNYVLFKYFLETVGQKLSYNDMKNYCAELRSCATEIERRYMGTYEDEKIKENGDVEVGKCFMTPFKLERFD